MSYIVRQKAANGRVCVHLAENHHVPELGQARQTRRHLGVLDRETGELRLAAGLPEPDQAILALLAKAGVKYDGKRANPRGRAPAPGAVRRPRLAAEDRLCRMEELGEAYVLGVLARESGLEGALCGALGERDGLAVLWVAMHQACTAEPQYLADEWLDDRRLPELLAEFDFSSAGLSRLSEAIGRSPTCRNRFLKRWIAACGNPEAIILDTTSISSHSDRLETAEWGHNRDEEALPQVNFTLAVDAAPGHLPLAYRMNFGSIPDVATLAATSEFLREYGLERVSYSTDKGFWSSANVAEMMVREMKFVMGVPQTNNPTRALVKKHRRKLDAPKRSILYNGHVVRHAQDKLTVEMPDGTKAILDAFLFMEPTRTADRVASFEQRTLELEQLAAKAEFITRGGARQWLAENAKTYAPYFGITFDGKTFSIIRKTNAIARKCNAAGVGVYATNRPGLDAASVLSIVRGRDAVEKVFDVIKNEDGQNRLHTGDPTRAEGRLFLAFIAAILHLLLEKKMGDADLIKLRSVAETLALLRKIKFARFESGRCRLLEIPKRTRKLLEAIKIPLPECPPTLPPPPTPATNG